MQQRRRITATRPAWFRPSLAVVLSTALVVGAAFGGNHILNTQAAGSGPIAALELSDSFANGENVVVDDAAISAQGGDSGPRTVKEFSRDEEFSMFALTWYGARDIATYVRAQNADGSWSPWYDAEPLAETGPDGKTGTELVYVEPTRKVQVSVAGVDLYGEEAPVEELSVEEVPAEEVPAEQAPVEEQPAEQAPAPQESAPAGTAPLPSNYGDIQPVAGVADASEIEAVFIDGRAEEGGIALANTSTTNGLPPVVSRARWSADESIRCSTPTIDDQVSAVTIHHTAGSNNYSQAAAAGQMRGIYQYHAATLGWCDVGYNAIVDKYGTIYEGRAGGLENAVRGAHAGGFNQNTWGIAMIGDYDVIEPPAEMIRAVGELTGWRAAASGFAPKGEDTHYSEGTSFTKFPYGAAVSLPNVFAHRDVGLTSCPGRYGYAQMDTIRQIAAEEYNSILSGQKSGGGLPSWLNPQRPGGDSPATTDEGLSSELSGELSSGLSSSLGRERDTGGNTDSLSGLLSAILSSDDSALRGADGSLAALAMTSASSSGQLSGELGTLGDAEIVEGLTLDSLSPVIDTIVSLSGDSAIEQTWNRISASFGPVLGDARSGITNYGFLGGESPAGYALFDNGIILDSGETGTHALWGTIADTWAAQGLERGPLGLPVSEVYSADGLEIADFQGGQITHDPATGHVDIRLN